MTVERDEMIENENFASFSTATGSAPSCYRVSALSGSLEVSARLKNADDLELLISVLEANKVLFTHADRPEFKISTKTDRPVTELSTAPETHVVAKGERRKTKNSTKANGSVPKIFMEADQAEPEILTLT